MHSWSNCYTLENLPPGLDEGDLVPVDGVAGRPVVVGSGPVDGVVDPDEGDLVPVDGVAGRPVVVGSGPVNGAVDPVGGLVDPGVVGPGRHWLMHPQRLFKLNVCQMIRIILDMYRV